MDYLIQPRGPGTGWVFRMITPRELVGLPNPWTGKPVGREIKRGLGTRHAVEARKQRDIAPGRKSSVVVTILSFCARNRQQAKTRTVTGPKP
ncbi:hypothetical protein [Maliponia aquimaris]|nr:hypothetical protein [Maliponia aquimaris]